MSFFDFHTHDANIPPGSGVVCLPRRVLLQPTDWQPQPQGLYAAGIHPWQTAEPDFSLSRSLAGLEVLIQHPQVIHIGECGLDRLRGGSIEQQQKVFDAQVELSEQYQLPLTLHIVRAFDLVLAAKKRHHPSQVWTIHGFRGKPTLARQLLSAGFHLSFGLQRNVASYALTPPAVRHEETDANPMGEY